MNSIDEIQPHSTEKLVRVLFENPKAVPLLARRGPGSRGNEFPALFNRVVLMTPGQPGRNFSDRFAHSFIETAVVIITKRPQQEGACSQLHFHFWMTSGNAAG